MNLAGKKSKLPKKAIETLIEFYEESINNSKRSLNNDLQQAIGVDHIKVEILKSETELSKLKKELIQTE